MCDDVIILNVDHSNSNDEFNWLSNSSNPISTNSNQLILSPDVSTATFRRGLGTIDPAKNRIKVIINMDLFRPTSSTQNKVHAIFGVYCGTTLIDEFSIFEQGISPGQKITYNFDRVYKYESLSGNISLKISFVDGWENKLLLDYLKCINFNYCQEKVRTYFVFNNFLEDCLNSVSSAVQLLEWKIDGVESLTSSFFNENNSPGGDLISRKFAKSNIDGSNRVSENTNPNTFNPFFNDFGLSFETISSFYGGKPIGTISGSDYGSEILNIGVDKHSVLNGQLISKKGAFFIDLDFTKSFKIVINAVVNNYNSQVFVFPSIFRQYYIVWDAENCIKEFYFQDKLSKTPLTNINVIEDGFLSGITKGESKENVLTCNDSFSYNGVTGVYETQMDFGNTIGLCGINYNSFDVPDSFEIEWNGQIFKTGFVGKSQYDQQLINLGINPSEINTTPSGNSSGQLMFLKDQISPSLATIRVNSPINGSTWNVNGICPQEMPGEFVLFVWDDTQTTEDRSGTLNEIDTFVNSFLFPINNPRFEFNLGGIWYPGGIVNENTFYDLDVFTGLNIYRIAGEHPISNTTIYSNELKYTKI